MCDRTMQGWFTRSWLKDGREAPWRDTFMATPTDAFLGVINAVKGTDFYTPTSGLRLPTLGLAGAEDGMIPPDMTRECVDLVPGSEFHLIRKSGHLSCVDQPEVFAQRLSDFMRANGHI